MRNRILSIDVLRGAAVLAVVQQHIVLRPLFLNVLDMPVSTVSFMPSGWIGVDLFFVISAFLLTNNLLRHTGERRLTLRFYLRRALRILPLYWILLFSGFMMQDWWLANGGSRDFWLWRNHLPLVDYLLLIQNWRTAAPFAYFYLPTWSLAAEEQFYLLLPLALAGLSHRIFAWLAGAMIIFSPMIRMVLLKQVSPSASYFWTLAHLDAFSWGILLALEQRFPGDLKPQVSRRFCILATISLIFLALMLAPGGSGSPLGLSLSSLASALAVLGALRPGQEPMTEPGRLAQGLAWCGRRCYSIYLFHYPVMGSVYLAAGGWDARDRAHGSALLVAISILATFILAAFTFRFVEQPLIKLADRIAPYARAPGTALAGESAARPSA